MKLDRISIHNEIILGVILILVTVLSLFSVPEIDTADGLLSRDQARHQRTCHDRAIRNAKIFNSIQS